MADTTTQIYQNAPWTAQQPFLTYGFDQAKGLYGTGGPQYYPNSTVAPMSTGTLQGIGALENLAISNPTAQANNQLGQVVGGQYLNNNPYLDATFNRAADQVSRQFSQATMPGIQAQFSMAGRTGSGAMQNAQDWATDMYGRQLSGLATDIYGGNYANERGMQQQAALAMPQFQQGRANLYQSGLQASGLRDAQSQAELEDQVNRYQFNQMRPWDTINRYMQLIGGGYGQSGSSTTKTPGPSTTQQVIGGLLAGGGLLSSFF